jgi:transposase-like protein
MTDQNQSPPKRICAKPRTLSRRRESSVEEAMMEMYLAGVSVRRVEDITEALWGTRVSPSTVSTLNKKIYATIETWRNAPIEGSHPYVFLDGIVMKRIWAGQVRAVSLLVAFGVNEDGYREILGIVEGAKEDKAGWQGFLRHLKERGLKGVQLIVSDACMGLKESVHDFYPGARWQRCVVHAYRNVFSHVPSGKVREVSMMLKAIHAQESLATAQQKTLEVVEKLTAMKLPRGDCQIFCARGRFSSSDDEPVAEDDGELGLGLDPLARRPFPFLGRLIENEV